MQNPHANRFMQSGLKIDSLKCCLEKWPNLNVRQEPIDRVSFVESAFIWLCLTRTELY